MCLTGFITSENKEGGIDSIFKITLLSGIKTRFFYLIYPDFQHDLILSGINNIIFVLKQVFSLNLTSCGR